MEKSSSVNVIGARSLSVFVFLSHYTCIPHKLHKLDLGIIYTKNTLFILQKLMLE